MDHRRFLNGGRVMMTRPVKLLARVLGNLIMIALLAAGWGAWRLSQGPISLALFEERIEAALSDAATGRSAHIGGAEIALSEVGRHPTLRLTDLSLSKNGAPLLLAREATATLDRAALLSGRFKLRELSAIGGRMIIERAADGRVGFGLAPDAPEAAAAEAGGPPAQSWIDTLRLIAEGDGLAVRLVDASVELVDRAVNHTWRLEHATAAARRTPSGSEIEADATWPQEEGLARLGLRISWDAAGAGQAGVALRISGLRPARLAELHPDLADLAGVDLPLSGVVAARFDGAERLLGVETRLEVGAGQVVDARLPERALRIEQGRLAADWTAAPDRVTLSQASLRLINGTELTAAGVIEGLTGDGSAQATADLAIHHAPLDDLGRLWPAALAPNPRAWMLANLSEGTIDSAAAKVRLTRPRAGAEWIPAQVGGAIQFSKARVQYVKGLPLVEKVDGGATFDLYGMDVSFPTGVLNRLTLTDGKALIRGFDAPEQTIDISLTVAGPLSDALAVVDHDPLHYARQVGLDPKQIRGDAKADLKFKFPLLGDLRFSQVDLSVKSALTGVRLPKVARDADLTDAALTLDLTRDKLSVAGQGKLAGAAAKLKWDETFTPKSGQARRKLTAQMTLDEPGRALLGLNALADWLKGQTPVEIELTELNDRARSTAIAVRADLGPTTLLLTPLAWTKPPGVPAQVKAVAQLKSGKIDAVTDLLLAGAGIDAKGGVRFAPDGTVALVQLDRLRLDRSDLTATLRATPGGGWAIEALGPALDLAAKQAQKEEPAKPGVVAPPEPPLSLSARFDRVHLADGGLLREVALEARREGDRWMKLDARAKAGGEGGSLWVKIQPDGPSGRMLAGRAENAGSVLSALGLSKALRGGVVHWAGRFDDSAGGRLRLTLKGEDYRVVGLSGLAKLFGAVTLMGIPDLFGEGVGFQTLTVDAVRDDRNWVIQDARAAGYSVGLTAKGRISRADDTLSLSGLIVPVNALNQVLGAIPLLGDVITGGRGGGLIAWSWKATGPANDPDVSVNPLSMLAPGILRNLFDSSESETVK